jgi:CheY-like chemotaxis protein
MLDICLAMDTLGGLVDSKQPLVKAEAVLLVDDDDLYVRAMTRQLRALGYPYVFRACSAAEALDMLQRVRPTVVLTDMVMEHREAGRWVITAADQLGVAVAVVSGMPGLDEAVLGHRFCRKSDLDTTRLEQLVVSLIAENRAARRESEFPARLFSARIAPGPAPVSEAVRRKTG